MHRRAQELQHLGRGWRGTPELVDAAVVRDAIEPGAEGELAIGGAQPGVRPDEDVLERVLGVLAVDEHLARVGEQPLSVAIVDDPERVVVTGAEQGDQLFIGTQAQKWPNGGSRRAGGRGPD